MPITPATNMDRFRRPHARIRKEFLPCTPEQVWVDRQIADHPQTLRILNTLGHLEADIIDDITKLIHPSDIAVAKRQLILMKHRKPLLQRPLEEEHNPLFNHCREINLIAGSPFDISYCPLPSRRAQGLIPVAIVDIETACAEIHALLTAHATRFFHMSLGKMCDGMAFDPLLQVAALLIRLFSNKPNAILEIKTRTASLEHLLGLKHRQRTILSWWVNTPQLIASEERGTASLEERLKAAAHAVAAGYRVGFHLDPIIMAEGTEAEGAAYLEVINALFTAVQPSSIAWVTLGMLRYPKELIAITTARFPHSRIFTGEYVPDGGWLRPPRFMREHIYHMLWNKLREKLDSRQIFLAMETAEFWKKFDPTILQPHALETRLRHLL